MKDKIPSLIRLAVVMLLASVLSACATLPNKKSSKSGARSSDASGLTRSRYGNPESYVVLGKRYKVLNSSEGYNKTGTASWYGEKFHGKLTSTREVYNMHELTAASTELPLPTYARVTNLENGRSIVVKINDRGPFVHNRLIDLSYAAAKKLGYAGKGTTKVQVTALEHSVVKQPSGKPTTPKRAEPIYMQVASFSNRNNAERLSQRLTSLTKKAVQIDETIRNDLPVYRVQIGPLKHNNERIELEKMLTNYGFDHLMTVAVGDDSSHSS